jgi:hypothetical protein
MNISIKCTNKNSKKRFAKGEIIIKNFKEAFYSTLECWTIEDYQRQ